MFNLQGKNVVLLGGLNGIGLSLAKNLMLKNIENLCIIDIMEDKLLIKELQMLSPNTNIMFNLLNIKEMNAENIKKMLNELQKKLKNIDLLINGLECIMDRDLQKTIQLNMNLYLNTMLIAREMMDMTKGGRGGLIINLLSALGLEEDKINLQQYLLSKQMLLSMTESLSQDIRNRDRGVKIMAIMPNMNQRLLLENMGLMKDLGLKKMIRDLNLNTSARDLDLLEEINANNRGLYEMNLRGRDLMDEERRKDLLLDYRRQGLGGRDLLLDERRRDLLDLERRRDLLEGEGRRSNLLLDDRRRNLSLDCGDMRRRDILLNDAEMRRRDIMGQRRQSPLLDDMILESDSDSELQIRRNRMLDDMDLRRNRLANRRQRLDDLDLNNRMDRMRLEGDNQLLRRGKLMDLLAINVIRSLEMAENGMLLLIGLHGIRNLQDDLMLQRL